jgi:hypothetical protein
MNSHSTPGDRRSNRIGEDEDRAVEAHPADHAFGHDRQEQGRNKGEDRHCRREPERAPQRSPVIRIGQHLAKIIEADKADRLPERVLCEHTHLDGLPSRPKEEYQRHRQLRREQQIRQQLVVEDDAALHEGEFTGSSNRKRRSRRLFLRSGVVQP